MSRVSQYIFSKGLKILEGGCVKDQRDWFQRFLVDHPEIKTVLEIGFNAGEGAEAILDSRSDISMTSVDIGRWDYTKVGKEFIDSEYPGRHTLLIGDSKKVLADLTGNYDLIFINGCHAGDHPYYDIKLCKKLSNLSTVLIVDDFGNSHGLDVKKCWDKCVAEGIVSTAGELIEPANDRKWWVGSYLQTRVIMINAYNRHEYLSRVLESLSVCDELDKWDVFYFQDGLKDGGHCKQTANVANKWLDVIQSKAHSVHRAIYDDNKNIGIRQFHAFETAFITAGADVVLVLEDDTVISPTYLTTIYNLLKYAEQYLPTVGYVSGNYAEETELKHDYDLCCGEPKRRQITWATGHLRSRWMKMYQKYRIAHNELFVGKPYLKHTPEDMAEAVRDYNRVYDALGLRRNHCFSQDSVQMECYFGAGFKDALYPTLRHALPIGEVGLHFTPEIFKRHKLDNVTDDWHHPAWVDTMSRIISGLT